MVIDDINIQNMKAYHIALVCQVILNKDTWRNDRHGHVYPEKLLHPNN